MEYVLLGIGIGLLSVLPPGPVTMTLLQFGAQRGTRPALHGAAGIVVGDGTVVWVALLIVGAGSTLPGWAFAATQYIAAAVLVGLGLTMLAVPSRCNALVDRIERPGRTFFLLTSLTPTVLGAWIAVLAAMPFASDVGHLFRFAIGAVLASALWHPLLALAGGSLGRWADVRRQRRLAQCGGLATIGMGVAALATSL